jgi:hypothetical protein
MTSPSLVLNEDDPNAVVEVDGRTVRNLTAEEYAASYADGDAHVEGPPGGPSPAQAARSALRRLVSGFRSTPPLKWMPAYDYGGPFTPGRPIGVVCHSTESANNPGSAEAIAGPGWFGGPAAGTSAHKVVDQDSICEGVKRNIIAWHVGPGGNGLYIGYEFCGSASWDYATWRQPEQLAMIANAAPYIADDLRYCGAPARWLSIAQVAALQKGLLTHNDVRLALGGTTHTDPGANFPYAELLAAINGQPVTPLPAPAPEPVPVVGPTTAFPYPHDECFGLLTDPSAKVHGGFTAAERAYVKYLQQRLQALGFAPSSAGWADGLYEQATIDAVAAWQHARMPGTTIFGQVWFDDWAALVQGGGGAPVPPPAPAGPVAPGWALPAGHWLGNLNGGATQHGGIPYDPPAVVAMVRYAQQRFIQLGCVPGVSDWRSGWADGKWEAATDAACRTWFARHRPGQQFTTRIYSDDWAVLTR